MNYFILLFKKIVWFWNLLYYFSYRLDYQFHLIFNDLNPMRVIDKLPSQKGKNNLEIVNRVFKDPKNGLSAIRSLTIMSFIAIFISSIFGILYLYFIDEFLPKYILYSMLIIPLIINHLLLYWKERYLLYFSEFDKKPKEWKVRWGIICLIFVLICLAIPITLFNVLLI